MNYRFSIIIPNYNSAKWIGKCLQSVLNQTYCNYELIVIDDMSTDNSLEIIKSFPKAKVYEMTKKVYNGGARNIGVEKASGEYIIFLDCDDWFYSSLCLSEISKVIDRSHPDCVRLPYQASYKKRKGKLMLHEPNLDALANTVFVAPWTKCIKRELFVPFPENTLLEDVVQHIAQIDVIETLDYCPIPVVVWNRDNPEAISSDTMTYDKNSKRYSSVYRNMADLLDLRCTHDYCERQRQFRIRNYEDIIQRGDILGLINGVKTR